MKRTVVTLTLVLMLTLTAAAWAILPAHNSDAPADNGTFVAMRVITLGERVADPQCPYPNGSGGGC